MANAACRNPGCPPQPTTMGNKQSQMSGGRGLGGEPSPASASPTVKERFIAARLKAVTRLKELAARHKKPALEMQPPSASDMPPIQFVDTMKVSKVRRVLSELGKVHAFVEVMVKEGVDPARWPPPSSAEEAWARSEQIHRLMVQCMCHIQASCRGVCVLSCGSRVGVCVAPVCVCVCV